MRKRFALPCLLAAFGASPMAWGEEPAPPLTPAFPVGRRIVQRIEFVQESEFQLPSADAPIRQKLECAEDVALSIPRGLPDGGCELELEYVGIRMAVATGDRNLMYDSASPAPGGAPNPLQSALGGLAGARVRFTLDRDHEIKKVEGARELVEKLLSEADGAQAREVVGSMLSESALSHTVRAVLTQGVPATGVRVGDAWERSDRVDTNTYGSLVVESRYTFKGWEKRQGRSCARVESVCTTSPNETDAGAGGRPRVVWREGRAAGRAWVDPELGVAVAGEGDEEATFAGSPAAPNGPPAWTCKTKMHSTLTLIDVGPIPPPPRAPTEEEIKTWIRDLGADEFARREAATQKLEDAGEAAVPLLQKVESDDAEVRSRVQALLEGTDGPPLKGEPAAYLKQLVNHEAVWRQNDSDKNGLQDYWTRDVAGFHCIRDANNKPVMYISLALARRDAAPAMAYPELGKAKRVRTGYLFKALTIDQDGNPYTQAGLPAPTARGAPAGVCGNQARFGFCAFPVRYGVDGKLTYIVNEDGTVWQKDLGPGAKGIDSRKDASPETAGSGWSQWGG